MLGLVLPFWAKYAAIALLLAAVFGYGYVKGNAHGTQKLTDYTQKQAAEATRIAKVRTVVTQKVLTNYLKVAGETQVVTNTIEKEVIRYENAKLDSCVLSAAARSLHDAAAANRLSNTAESANGAAAPVEAATYVKTSTENYATCHAIRDRLIGLQEWIVEQSKVR